MSNDRLSSIVLGISLVIGLVGAAAILGISLKASRATERSVIVRGVAEREVKADLAVWPINVRAVGDNLVEANRTAEAAKKKVLAFLAESGIQASDLASQTVRVSDRQAADYVSPQAKQMLRYLVVHIILVRTSAVDRVRQASQMTDKLVGAGVLVSATEPQFYFTGLNSVKPAMLADATRTAREAANQFASDSGSKVGSIRRAQQGLFAISDRDQALRSGDAAGGGYSSSDPNKKVRVVVTVDYALQQ